MTDFSPREIVSELDRFIIGQKDAKRAVAVALHYDGHGAPRVTAKGRGYLAEDILALARAHDIPLHEDAALVSLLARLELNEQIPEKLYRAVAEVLASRDRTRAGPTAPAHGLTLVRVRYC